MTKLHFFATVGAELQNKNYQNRNMSTPETGTPTAEAIEQQHAAQNYAMEMQSLDERLSGEYVPTFDELKQVTEQVNQIRVANQGGNTYPYGPDNSEIDSAVALSLTEKASTHHWIMTAEEAPIMIAAASRNVKRANQLSKAGQERFDVFKQSEPEGTSDRDAFARFKFMANRRVELTKAILEDRKQHGGQVQTDVDPSLISQLEANAQAQDWRRSGNNHRGAGHTRSAVSNSRRSGSNTRPQAAAPTPAPARATTHRRATREATTIDPTNFEPIADQPETTLAGKNPTWNEDAVIKSRRHAGKDVTEIDPANFPEAQIQPMTKPAGTEHSIDMDPRPRLPRRPKATPAPETDTDVASAENEGDTSTISPEHHRESVTVRMANIIEGLSEMPPTSMAELDALKKSVSYKNYIEGLDARGNTVRQRIDGFVDEKGKEIDPKLVKRFEEVMNPQNWTLDRGGLTEARQIINASNPKQLGNITRSALARWRQPGENNDTSALRRAQDYYRARILMNADVRTADKLTNAQLQAIERQRIARYLTDEFSEPMRRAYAEQRGFIMDGPQEKRTKKFYILTEKERHAVLDEFGTSEYNFREFKTSLASRAAKHHLAVDAETAAREAMKGMTNRNRLDRRALRRGEISDQAAEQNYPANVSERELLIAGLKKTIAQRIVDGMPTNDFDGLRQVEQGILKDIWEEAARLNGQEQAALDDHKQSPKTKATPAPNNKGYKHTTEGLGSIENDKRMVRIEGLRRRAGQLVVRMSVGQAAALGVLPVATPVTELVDTASQLVTAPDTAGAPETSHITAQAAEVRPAEADGTVRRPHLVHRTMSRVRRSRRPTATTAPRS